MTFVDLARGVAVVPTAMAAVVVVVGFGRALLPRHDTAATLASTLALALELFLAAGLIRLAAVDSPTALATAALVIAVRRVIGIGLRYAQRAVDGPPV